MGEAGPIVSSYQSRAAGDLRAPSAAGSSEALHNLENAQRESQLNLEVVTLYQAHAEALLRYALAVCGDSELAQDAVQEAFLRYYIAFRTCTIQGDSKSWLYSTTRNYILDRLKEYYVRNSRSLNAAAHIAEEAAALETQLLLREIDDAAHGLLSPREMECLQLRNDGLRYQDIADLLEIETATVGVLLGRALKKLRAVVNHSENGG
jgi:RNA polymerase sigma-70 factor (ECF subfamily)